MSIDLPTVLGGPDTEGTLAYRLSDVFFAAKVRYFEQLECCDNQAEGTLEMLLEFPGSIWTPAFDGFKVRRYSRKQSRIQICFAVPSDLLNSARFAEFFFESLTTAIGIAKERFDKDGIPFDRTNHSGFVDTLRQLDLRTAKPLPWVEKLRRGEANEPHNE